MVREWSYKSGIPLVKRDSVSFFFLLVRWVKTSIERSYSRSRLYFFFFSFNLKRNHHVELLSWSSWNCCSIWCHKRLDVQQRHRVAGRNRSVRHVGSEQDVGGQQVRLDEQAGCWDEQGRGDDPSHYFKSSGEWWFMVIVSFRNSPRAWRFLSSKRVQNQQTT